MAKLEFLDLMSLSNVVLTEFERLEFTKPTNVAAGVELITITEASLISDFLADNIPYDADGTVPYVAINNALAEIADETPFTFGDISSWRVNHTMRMILRVQIATHDVLAEQGDNGFADPASPQAVPSM